MGAKDGVATFLLLNSTLPAGAVRLGRFVRLPYHPESDFQPHNPAVPAELIMPSLEENVERILANNTADGGLRNSLARLLGYDESRATTTHLAFSSNMVLTRRFVNAGSQLGAMLEDQALTAWLRQPAQVKAGKVFLVVGMKSFFEANVIERYKASKNLSSTAPLEFTDLLGFVASSEYQDRIEHRRTLVGENIFAVEYRPLKLKTLHLQDVQQLGKSTYGPGELELSSLGAKDLIDAASGLFILAAGSHYVQVELGEDDADEIDIEEAGHKPAHEIANLKAVYIPSGEAILIQGD